MKDFKKFFQYSFAPCKLHFCGPTNKSSYELIEDYLDGKDVDLIKLEEVANTFIGVIPYLKLIADRNNLEVFDTKVIEAYWLGNMLLKKVKVSDLKEVILKEFQGENKLNYEQAKKLADNIPDNMVVHHSFHVMYVGSVTHTIKIVGKLIDLCRISWGEVRELKEDSLIVKYLPVIADGGEVRLSEEEIIKEIKWDKRLIKEIARDNIVTFHWDTVCDVITKVQSRNIEKFTINNIKALTNV